MILVTIVKSQIYDRWIGVNIDKMPVNKGFYKFKKNKKCKFNGFLLLRESCLLLRAPQHGGAKRI
jgi:hypothetical protein